MNSLYVLLAIVGALILVGIVVQGLWQSRKASKMLQGPLDDHSLFSSDVQNDAEPVWDENGVQADQDHIHAHAGFTASKVFEGMVDLQAGQLHTSLADPLIDSIITIDLEHPVSGGAVLSVAPKSRRAGSKPMFFEGFNEQSQSWEPLRTDTLYQKILVALQLANRTGALNEIEFSEFIMKIQNFADALGGAFEAPDMIETVAHARELDQFASDHDAQLNIYLVSNRAAWYPSFLQQQAAALGFVAGSVPGRLVIPSMQTGAPPVLTLQYDMQAAMADDPNMMPISNITLTLDVPQTDRIEQPFKLLYKVAAALSKSLDASVVDEQGVPLNSQAFDAIYDMLEQLYDQLDQRGLNAGSSAARRLFS